MMNKLLGNEVYYYFYNITRNEKNTKPIPGFGGYSWVAKLLSIEVDIKSLFKTIIEVDNWSENDAIRAVPDYTETAVEYINGNIKFDKPWFEELD